MTPAPMAPFAPLVLATLLGVPQRTIAARLRVTPATLRRSARAPRHVQRVRIAELEAILEQVRVQARAEAG